MIVTLVTNTRIGDPCGRERELLILPATPVRISAPDRKMGKQLWNSSTRVNEEAERSITFKHRKWKFPITAKVLRTVDECLRTCVCVCVCVFNFHYLKDRAEKIKKPKQICERPLPSPSQDRDHEVSGLYESTVKWLRTQVGGPCFDSHTETHR